MRDDDVKEFIPTIFVAFAPAARLASAAHERLSQANLGRAIGIVIAAIEQLSFDAVSVVRRALFRFALPLFATMFSHLPLGLARAAEDEGKASIVVSAGTVAGQAHAVSAQVAVAIGVAVADGSVIRTDASVGRQLAFARLAYVPPFLAVLRIVRRSTTSVEALQAFLAVVPQRFARRQQRTVGSRVHDGVIGRACYRPDDVHGTAHDERHGDAGYEPKDPSNVLLLVIRLRRFCVGWSR